jgi:hypothetical protein
MQGWPAYVGKVDPLVTESPLSGVNDAHVAQIHVPFSSLTVLNLQKPCKNANLLYGQLLYISHMEKLQRAGS